MRNFIVLILALFSLSTFAASGGGDGAPLGTVLSQIINLGLLIGIIYFWQGKTIASAFRSKKEDYLKGVESAKKSVTFAETRKKEIEQRISDLRSNYERDVSDAKNNAEESYRSQLAQAKNDAIRITESANTSLESEVQREIENLRVQAYAKSAKKAEEKLGKSLTADQQKVWNQHFTSQVKEVH